MKILSWNCRGLGQPQAIPVIREFVTTHRPEVVFLFETLASTSKVEEVRIKLGFESALAVECVGRSGGICVLWKYESRCSVVSFSIHHIDLTINDDKHGVWRLTGYYGQPDRNRRKESWELIRKFHRASTLPWCIIGDFNDLLCQEEKRGRIEHPNWLLCGFRETIVECDLNDLPLQGYPFTWERSKGTE